MVEEERCFKKHKSFAGKLDSGFPPQSLAKVAAGSS